LRRFREEVHKDLEDPDGWKSRGYRVLSSDGQRAAVTIILTSPATLKENGCKDENLSCAILNGGKVWINCHALDRRLKGKQAEVARVSPVRHLA
jgi:hypothetical protein